MSVIRPAWPSTAWNSFGARGLPRGGAAAIVVPSDESLSSRQAPSVNDQRAHEQEEAHALEQRKPEADLHTVSSEGFGQETDEPVPAEVEKEELAREGHPLADRQEDREQDEIEGEFVELDGMEGDPERSQGRRIREDDGPGQVGRTSVRVTAEEAAEPADRLTQDDRGSQRVRQPPQIEPARVAE